jgi:hypothetical protein
MGLDFDGALDLSLSTSRTSAAVSYVGRHEMPLPLAKTDSGSLVLRSRQGLTDDEVSLRRRLRESFAASDISSDIELAKLENGSEQTKTGEGIRKALNCCRRATCSESACLY